MTKTKGTVILTILLLGLLGCGGLRYSQVAPEAKDFHPQRIAVLPADTTAFPEAKDSIDRVFAEVLAERKWFTDIVGGEGIGRRLETDAELRQTVTEYLAKLRNVSYSDPELSSMIGRLTRTEAFLLVRVDYWNYTTEDDTKMGKVGISITMIEAKTGKTIWRAVHNRASDYMIIKPDLPDVARSLIREMIGHMPH
ncbi:MAG: hypothetical protein IH628_08330 [Proteobacteria bacterium]|nr:hypothetical protein [Pseudomonadota bacterium]